jgi:hypothetical protein
MTKQEELTQSGSTLDKADPSEPLFILRAQDQLAPLVVRYWITAARAHGMTNAAKLAEAEALAVSMEQWPTRKYPD